MSYLVGKLARLWPSDPLIHNPEQVKNVDLAQALLNYCQANGITSIVYNNLKAHGLLSHLPSAIAKKFKQVYYQTLTQNLKYKQTLAQLAPIFFDRPAIILKGLALSSIYKNPAMRPMSDIDLLVHPTDLQEIKHRLYDLDFQPAPTYPDILVRENQQIDLHIHPFNTDRIAARNQATPLDLKLLWQKATAFSELTPFKKLDLPHQILTLSVHALKHGFERDIWLLDILGSINQAPPSQWQTVIECCQNARALGILAYSMHAIANRLQDEIPDYAQEVQKNFPIGSIRRKILKTGIHANDFQILEPLILIQSMPGIVSKLACLSELIFPQRSILTQISGLTGKWTFYLSYPYRILQLLTRGASQMSRLFVHLLRHR